MLSIRCVRLTIKVKVGIPESFKEGWYPRQKKLGWVTLRSTNIPEEISSALTEGPSSILAIVVTKQKQKSQIVGSDYLIVLEHLHIIMIFLLPLEEGIHGNKWMNLTNTKQKRKSQIVGLVNIHHYLLNKNRSNHKKTQKQVQSQLQTAS